jgi:hypothetical protein
MHRRSFKKDTTFTTEDYSKGSQLTPRTRQTASLFVADWIDNAPFDGSVKEHEIEKPKYFARAKNVPRSGPFSSMYFGNDVLLCARNRTSGEIQEEGKHRSSLRLPSASNDTTIETESSSPARSRATPLSSSRVSSLGLKEDSHTPVVAQRAKRNGAVSPSRKSRESPRNQQASICKQQTTKAANSEGDASDQDLFRREREFFLKERSVFLREREQFLTDKERFQFEKEKLIQDIRREKEGIAREKEELAHQRDSSTEAAANDSKVVEVPPNEQARKAWRARKEGGGGSCQA